MAVVLAALGLDWLLLCINCLVSNGHTHEPLTKHRRSDDFSKMSVQAIQIAKRLARRFGASIHSADVRQSSYAADSVAPAPSVVLLASVTLKVTTASPFRNGAEGQSVRLRCTKSTELGTTITKTIRQLTFAVITALFVVTVALLWASASPKASGKSPPPVGFAPLAPTGLAPYAVGLPALDGLFQAPWRGFDTGTFGHGFGPKSFAVGDLDGDGDLDILVGDSFFGSTGISVLKNNGDQTFAAPVYYSLPQSQTVGEVAFSDFDFDGDLDAFATIRGDSDQLT